MFQLSSPNGSVWRSYRSSWVRASGSLTHLLLCNSAGFHILSNILNNRFARLTDLMSGLYTAMISQSMSEDTSLRLGLSLSLSLAMISDMRSASLDFLTDRILMSSNLLTHYYGLCSAHLLWLQSTSLDRDCIRLGHTGRDVAVTNTERLGVGNGTGKDCGGGAQQD